MSREEKDKKNKQAGIFISVGTHIAVILLFIFLIAWRAPNPPLPEFGIELNFGTSDQGTGDVQPETTPAEAEQEEDALPDTPEEVVEETVEETTETVEETTEVTDAVEEEIVTEQETDDPVNEPEKTTEEVKPEEAEEKKEEPKLPKLYPEKKDGDAGNTGEAKDSANANEGDEVNTEGDKGDKEGSVNDKALMGKQGGGDGGPDLKIAGWNWDRVPRPEHDNVEFDGKITFDFQVDEKGQVISIKTIPPSTVRTSLIQLYRDELEKATFYQTGSGTALPMTKGRVTFIIKAK